jgi:uncharacterized repeat protein (TIGR01451 family)
MLAVLVVSSVLVAYAVDAGAPWASRDDTGTVMPNFAGERPHDADEGEDGGAEEPAAGPGEKAPESATQAGQQPDGEMPPAVAPDGGFAGDTEHPAHIIAKKYLDENRNGERDGGEAWLAGFTFRLESATSAEGPWAFEAEVASVDPAGRVDFGMYCTGWYRITEVLSAGQLDEGWCATSFGWTGQYVFHHTPEKNCEKWFGNTVIHPAIGVAKGAAEESYRAAGDLIHYTIAVGNPGDIHLSDVTVVDPLIDDLAYVEGDTGDDGVLDLDETWIYEGSYAVTQDDVDAGSVVNVVTAEGVAPNGARVSAEASATVLAIPEASLALEKTGVLDAGSDGYADPGELVTYTLVVTNTGTVTLTGVTVTDPLLTDVTFVSGDSNLDGKMQLDEVWVYVGTYPITAEDIAAGSVYNLATADSTESDPADDDTTVTLPTEPWSPYTPPSDDDGDDDASGGGSDASDDDDDYLPYTGADLLRLALAAAAATGTGLLLRKGRRKGEA